jgi:hypothetical protein
MPPKRRVLPGVQASVCQNMVCCSVWLARRDLLRFPFRRHGGYGRRNANEMVGLTLASFATLYGILLGLFRSRLSGFSSGSDIV